MQTKRQLREVMPKTGRSKPPALCTHNVPFTLFLHCLLPCPYQTGLPHTLTFTGTISKWYQVYHPYVHVHLTCIDVDLNTYTVHVRVDGPKLSLVLLLSTTTC